MYSNFQPKSNSLRAQNNNEHRPQYFLRDVQQQKREYSEQETFSLEETVMTKSTLPPNQKRKMNTNKKQRAASIRLAPPPVAISGSRKRARQVTTLFHRYTKQRDDAVARNCVEVQRQMDVLIEQLGGRREYQRASQISTSFYSTSKWVLGSLAQNGWIYGIPVPAEENSTEINNNTDDAHNGNGYVMVVQQNKRKKRPERRITQLLEIGAINTELLDAASEIVVMNDSTTSTNSDENNDTHSIVQSQKKTKYRLSVRAIDLNSTYEGIEEADFLQLPVPYNKNDGLYGYDVIVCSMVLNCVTTPAARGEMICRLHHFLRPGGMVYLTIPKTCLNLSPYIDRERFIQLLSYVGLEVLQHPKDSPKVAFFVCRKPEDTGSLSDEVQPRFDPSWSELTVIRQGKKYKNEFGIMLDADSVSGRTIMYEDRV